MGRRDTRELILTTSLALFNEHGEPNVTTNEIALEADISPGNLYYHFRSKDEITLELFKRYLVRIQPLIESGGEDPPDIDELWLRLHLICETMGHYRFLYRDLADLHSRLDRLRHAFNALMARAHSAIAGLLERLRDTGALHMDDADIEALVDATLILLTYWIPYAEIHGDPGLEDGSTLSRAVARVLHLYVPWLDEQEARHLSALANAYLRA